MQDNYSFLLSVYEKVVDNLREGVRVCDAYTAAVSFIEANRPDLKDKFTRNVGWVCMCSSDPVCLRDFGPYPFTAGFTLMMWDWGGADGFDVDTGSTQKTLS